MSLVLARRMIVCPLEARPSGMDRAVQTCSYLHVDVGGCVSHGGMVLGFCFALARVRMLRTLQFLFSTVTRILPIPVKLCTQSMSSSSLRFFALVIFLTYTLRLIPLLPKLTWPVRRETRRWGWLQGFGRCSPSHSPLTQSSQWLHVPARHLRPRPPWASIRTGHSAIFRF